MQYRQLANSVVKVSGLGLGSDVLANEKFKHYIHTNDLVI